MFFDYKNSIYAYSKFDTFHTYAYSNFDTKGGDKNNFTKESNAERQRVNEELPSGL